MQEDHEYLSCTRSSLANKKTTRIFALHTVLLQKMYSMKIHGKME